MSAPNIALPPPAPETEALIAAVVAQLAPAHKKTAEPAPRTKEELLADPLLPEMYYAGGGGKYWVKHEGRFIELNETGVIRILKYNKFKAAPNKTTQISEIEIILAHHQMENNFDWIGTIAGWPVGCFEYDGLKLLNLRENVDWVLPPSPASTPKLDLFFLRLLGAEQADYLKAWVKLARETAQTGKARIATGRGPKFRIGQVLTLAGEAGHGKTVAGGLLGAMIAGPCATTGNPAQSIKGETQFNEDLSEKMVHLLDDETGDSDYKVRQKIGEALKRSVATSQKRIHGKGKKAITLEFYTRTILLLNDKRENLQALPPLDGPTGEKFIILKTVGRGFGDLEKDNTGYESRVDELLEEVPDYLAALLQWSIPPGIQDARYGVASYHDPDCVDKVAGLGGERMLAAVLQSCAAKNFDYKGEPVSIEQLFLKLVDSPETSKKLTSVARHSSTFGKLMARLREDYPGLSKVVYSHARTKYYSFDFSVLSPSAPPTT